MELLLLADPNAIGGIGGWIGANWGNLMLLIPATIGMASVIVKLTPTPKDDTVLASIIAFVNKFIALNK